MQKKTSCKQEEVHSVRNKYRQVKFFQTGVVRMKAESKQRSVNKIKQDKSIFSTLIRLFACSILSVFCLISFIACEKRAEGLAVEVLSSEVLLLTEGGEDEPIHDLFDGDPNVFVSMNVISRTIGPVGTVLSTDFDSDGVLNSNEKFTNIWATDYPQIEVRIATPIEIKIETSQTITQNKQEIVSEITSEDVNETADEGSEKIHRNEISERTVQFQDSLSRSNDIGRSTSRNISESIGASLTLGSFAGGGSKPRTITATDSWANHQGYSETKTKWATLPFKNHLDRRNKILKPQKAFEKALKYQRDVTQKVNTQTKIDPDAGFIRAALTIHNHSVNMPVRLTNILYTLMLETPEGELIPVQNFHLRNNDYSLLTVDIYGDSELGTYAVEFANLNTVKIQNAITQGYIPKIFIVDYEMKHVPGSNYSSRLLNYKGDNLRVIEENAKGSTALIRIFGPGLRKKYRVAAFSINEENEEDPCEVDRITQARPGVSLRKALLRLQCAGLLSVEFENYVYDFGGSFRGLTGHTRVFSSGIKAIAGIANKIPCDMETHTGSDGKERTACVRKPVSQWGDDLKDAGTWVVFAQGNFYEQTSYVKRGGQILNFNTVNKGETAIPITEGINSKIWAGDYYDIVYLRYADLVVDKVSMKHYRDR